MRRQDIRQIDRTPVIADAPAPARDRVGEKGARHQDLEVAARAELEGRAGRRFSDEEWAAARRRLIEFMRLLRGWHQQARMDRPQAAEVVTINERLPKAA